MIVCNSSEKPLMLFYLVHTQGATNALVFTKSAESTTRLVRLFEFFESTWTAGGSNITHDGRQQIVARAYSSDLSPTERKSILEKFKNQEIHMCVRSAIPSIIVISLT